LSSVNFTTEDRLPHIYIKQNVDKQNETQHYLGGKGKDRVVLNLKYNFRESEKGHLRCTL